jgi:hypothetical protein
MAIAHLSALFSLPQPGTHTPASPDKGPYRSWQPWSVVDKIDKETRAKTKNNPASFLVLFVLFITDNNSNRLNPLLVHSFVILLFMFILY